MRWLDKNHKVENFGLQFSPMLIHSLQPLLLAGVRVILGIGVDSYLRLRQTFSGFSRPMFNQGGIQYPNLSSCKMEPGFNIRELAPSGSVS